MYLRPEDVDAMAPWAVERSRSGKLSHQSYKPPPWACGLDDGEARRPPI